MINLNINSKDYNYQILTEQINLVSNELDTKSTEEIVSIFSEADKEPQKAVKKANPEIINAIDEITKRLKLNGRLFYIGTGTSGRLGVLDASECPPTFCTNPDLVQGVIAGGLPSLTRSSESLEDFSEIAINDLQDRGFSNSERIFLSSRTYAFLNKHTSPVKIK